MKNFKKAIALAAAVSIVAGVTACNGGGGEAQTSETSIVTLNEEEKQIVSDAGDRADQLWATLHLKIQT